MSLALQGQSRVPAARAQVLFSTTPLWSTAIAIVLLHEAALGTAEVAGGALIIFASVLAAK